MAETQYQVVLKDTAGAQVALFTGHGRPGGGLRAFSYHKRLRTPGAFVLQIDGRDDRVALFDLDGQVEFWRQDIRGGLTWYLDFEGFHRSWELTQDAEGQDVFTSRGRGYNDLLAAEPIRWAAGSTQACKSAAAETCAKEFVDENIGPGATSPPRDRAGVMPGLAIEADAATGAAWSGCRTNKNLLDVLVELAEFGPGDYMVVGTGAATFEYQWRDVRWGDDRTPGNVGGNLAVIFSSRLGNATNMTYRYSRLDEVNVVDVAGQGAGATRTIVTRTSGAEADSPWAVRAVCRDAKDLATAAELQARGDAVLAEQRSRHTVGCTVIQSPATRYGRDWFLGDLVRVEYTKAGAHVDQKIAGVTVTMDSDGRETISPELIDE